MKPLWELIVILACFGIAGRIDYETAVDLAAARYHTQAQR